MTEESCIKIEITKEIPFAGEEDSLETRLRKVALRGFPHIKIYENAVFEQVFLRPEEIAANLQTPQPPVYKGSLERVAQLAELFRQKGIDILNLDRAYDFVATSASGQETRWTMIPPIVERFNIPRHASGGFDYAPLIGDELRAFLQKDGLNINPAAQNLPYINESGVYDIINDGSHRVHHGLTNGGIKVIRITGMKSGFPYYAAPQSFSSVRVVLEANEETTKMKVHIVQEPAQKLLYRLFPSGGIMSGEVRAATKGEKFL